MSATAINLCATRSGICQTLAALGASDEQLEAVGYGTIQDTDLLNLLTGNTSELDTAEGYTLLTNPGAVSATAPVPPVTVESSTTDLVLGAGGSIINSASAAASNASNSVSGFFQNALSNLAGGIGEVGLYLGIIVVAALVIFLIFEFNR